VLGDETALDRDAWDEVCDHLLVLDHAVPDPEGPDGAQVVGTYRLLRESVARDHGGFYSAGEFDLAPLATVRAQGGGELLELGRSCVLPAWRTSAVISLLWRGIGEYLQRHRIGLMFGCASFAGTDPDAHAAALSWLYHHHLAPATIRPRVRGASGAAMERLPRGSYDERRAMLALPPLVKGYLRAGARFGDGIYIDHDFNTVDVCVVVAVEALAERYVARFAA
jgi:putative hemolysin